MRRAFSWWPAEISAQNLDSRSGALAGTRFSGDRVENNDLSCDVIAKNRTQCTDVGTDVVRHLLHQLCAWRARGGAPRVRGATRRCARPPRDARERRHHV
jgi:hypothetical protein